MWNLNYWNLNYWHDDYWAEDATAPVETDYTGNLQMRIRIGIGI